MESSALRLRAGIPRAQNSSTDSVIYRQALSQHCSAAKFEEARTLLAGDLDSLVQVTLDHLTGSALSLR